MPLSWNEVKRVDGLAVARLLGWEPVGPRQPKNFPCPVCGSSDALRFYPRQNWFHCFSHGGQGSKPLTTVDLVAHVRGYAAAEACRWLAGQLGIPCDSLWSSPAGAYPPAPLVRPRRTTAREEHLAALGRLVAPVEPHRVYARLHARLGLSARGAGYLRSRGLDPAGAARYGFRSLDRAEDWDAVRDELGKLRPEERVAAGFPTEAGKLVLPLGARAPLLLIPFWHAGALVGLRFRNLDPRAGRKAASRATGRTIRVPRYLSLPDAPPPWPFMADGLRSRIVHVVEGELNAWTLALAPYRMPGSGVCGIQGASVWRPAWTEAVRAAERVVLWYDDDHAGRCAVAPLRAAFARAHGEPWVQARLRRVCTPVDPNQLHQEGRLGDVVREAPWIGGEPPPLGLDEAA